MKLHGERRRTTRPRPRAWPAPSANSPLVKTAFYGRDANWGRIMQAIGQALGRGGHEALPAGIAYEDVDRGARRASRWRWPRAGRSAWRAIMDQPEIAVHVALNGPGAESVVYFSDLTHDYVTLNAEYTT